MEMGLLSTKWPPRKDGKSESLGKLEAEFKRGDAL